MIIYLPRYSSIILIIKKEKSVTYITLNNPDNPKTDTYDNIYVLIFHKCNPYFIGNIKYLIYVKLMVITVIRHGLYFLQYFGNKNNINNRKKVAKEGMRQDNNFWFQRKGSFVYCCIITKIWSFFVEMWKWEFSSIVKFYAFATLLLYFSFTAFTTRHFGSRKLIALLLSKNCHFYTCY